MIIEKYIVEIFKDQLKDVFCGENRLGDTLSKMTKKANSNNKTNDAFKSYLMEPMGFNSQ